MKHEEAFYRSFPITLLITIVAGAVLFIWFDRTWALGFFLGSFTTLFMMSRLNKTSYQIVKSESKQEAQKMAVRAYTFRFIFYAIILVVALLHPSFNLYTTMIGLFIFKIVLYILGLLEGRGEKNNG